MDEITIKGVLRKGERVMPECKRAKADVPRSVVTFHTAIGSFRTNRDYS